jgi:FAD/FMN-containing dehydrogenase
VTPEPGEAFDPITRCWVPSGAPAAVPLPALRGELGRDDAALRWAAEDFGHVVHHRPRAVLRPGGVADVVAMVAFAAEAGLSVAARGAGHSTYGQAQTAGGIVVDMAALAEVGQVHGDRITVQAGALWSEVLDATLAHGATPPVLTDYLGTSVGGTLSVGGVGGASHRHGLQVDSVLALDVVTGTGDVLSCSPEQNRGLFDAALAGLGQCGVITAATLRLLPAPARARCYRLYYQDLGSYLADQRLLVAGEGRFDYLEGQIVPGPGGWRCLLEVAVYYTPPSTPDDGDLLAGLAHDRADEEIEDLGYRDFQHRLAPGEAMLRATGEWLHPHAWLNVWLPAPTTAQVVSEVLGGLTAADLGHSGLAMLYPVRPDRIHAPLARVPESDVAWLFALLRTAAADDPTSGAAMIEANRRCYERAVAHGGTAYPVNTMPMSQDDWRAHFGPQWSRLLAAKDEFDPNRLLAPGQHVVPVS